MSRRAPGSDPQSSGGARWPPAPQGQLTRRGHVTIKKVETCSWWCGIFTVDYQQPQEHLDDLGLVPSTRRDVADVPYPPLYPPSPQSPAASPHETSTNVMSELVTSWKPIQQHRPRTKTLLPQLPDHRVPEHRRYHLPRIPHSYVVGTIRLCWLVNNEQSSVQDLEASSGETKNYSRWTSILDTHRRPYGGGLLSKQQFTVQMIY